MSTATPTWTQDFDLGWHLDARCGSLSGAELKTIFDHFVDAEFLADWDKAKVEHGDATTKAHLERTDGQRRFDALYAIFQKAAASSRGVRRPKWSPTWSSTTPPTSASWSTWPPGYGPTLIRTPKPSAAPPSTVTRSNRPKRWPPSLFGKLRRVVIGADSVVIDLGRSQRLFTGSARLAVQLGNTECFWPGCHVPVSHCQIDHLRPLAERDDGSGGGRTNPDNGGPACGKHNRHKEHGYTVQRDPTGHWHTIRPDGTEIG